MSLCEHKKQAEVEIGRHTETVTYEMAADAGCPEMEGHPHDCGPIMAVVLVCETCGEQLEIR